MADELRCCFEDKGFRYAAMQGNGYNLYNNPNPGSKAMWLDPKHSISKCWLQDSHDVAIYEINNEKKPYCLFHAPAELEPVSSPLSNGHTISRRGSTQGYRLKYWLDAWNEENASRDKNNQLAFILPHMQCGHLNLIKECYNFSGGVNFANAVFSGTVMLSGSIFNSFVNFQNAIFTNGVSFDSCTFNADATFEKAIFNGAAIFEGTRLDRCSFYEASFGLLNIEKCKLELPTSFQSCKIHKLKYSVHTNERLSFISCKLIIDEDHLKEDAHWDFTDSDCSKLSFTSCDLSYADFRGSYIDDTHLIACEYRKDDGEHYSRIYDGVENDISEEEGKRRLYTTYQNLKRNLEKIGNYRRSGDFHFREMEIRQEILSSKEITWKEWWNLKCLRKNKDLSKKEKEKQETLRKKGISWAEWVEWNVLKLYRLIGDFGESYKKLGGALLISMLCSTMIINLAENKWKFEYFNIFDSSYWANFKITVLSMIPAGFSKSAIGESIKCLNGFSQSILVIEWIIAVTLATLFVMAVRRNFRR